MYVVGWLFIEEKGQTEVDMVEPGVERKKSLLCVCVVAAMPANPPQITEAAGVV